MKRFALLLALAACGEIPVPEGAPTVTVRTNNSLDIHVLARANIEADRLCGEGMRAVPQGEVDGVTTYACVVR